MVNWYVHCTTQLLETNITVLYNFVVLFPAHRNGISIFRIVV